MSEEIMNEELEFAPIEAQVEAQIVEDEAPEAPVVVEEVEEAPALTTEESAVVVEEPVVVVEAPKKKKVSTPKAKRPGMYYQGKRIENVPARLGSKWTVTIDGKRHKVLKRDIEIVK